MTTNIIFLLLSVTINIAVILVFKKLSDEKNSFSKVTKYCKQFMQDLKKDFAEKQIQMKDFDNCLETKLQRGSIIIDKLDNTVAAFDSDSGKASVSPEMIKRISAVESKLAEMEDKPYSASSMRTQGSGADGRELYSQLSGLRKEVAVMMRELDKKKKDADESYRLFESRMKSEIEVRKSNLIEFVKQQESQFSENDKKFRKELDRIDSDISKMNKNFIKDASQNFTLLSQDYRMKFESLSKKYADMDAEYSGKLEKKIKECSEYIVHIEGRLTSLEESIVKELSQKKEDYMLDLAAKFTTQSSDISKFSEQLKTNAKAYILKTIKDNEDKSKSMTETFRKNEMQAQVTLKRYEEFLKESSERLDSSKNEFTSSLEQKLADFNSHLDTSKQMGIKLELDIFTEIKNKLETFRRDTDRSIESLHNKLDTEIDNYDKQINSKYSLIREDYTKATQDYNDLTMKYEKFSDSFAKTIEQNKQLCEEQGVRIKSKVSEMDAAIDSALKKWAETFNAEKQRIEDLFETDKKTLDDKRDKAAEEMSESIARYEAMMSTSLDNVKNHFEEEKARIFAEIDSIVAQIESNAAGKTGEISDRFDKTYSDFENRLSVIQDNMLQKASDIEQALLAKSDDINVHLTEEMDTFKSSVSDRSAAFERDINRENEAIIAGISAFKDDVAKMISEEKNNVSQDIASMRSDFDKAESALTDKLHNIETVYYDKGIQLLETNQTELSGYTQRFAQLSENISELQKTVEDKLYSLVSSGTKQIEDLFEQGRSNLTDRYGQLSDETSKQIDEYKSSLSKISKRLDELDNAYDAKFNDKIEVFNAQFATKLDKFNDEFRLNISRITEDARSYENDFVMQIDAVKKSITSDYNTFADDSKSRFDILNSDYNALNDSLTQMKLKIDQDVGAKIEDGKKKLDEQYSTLHDELHNMYLQEIDDAQRKYKETRENLERGLTDYKNSAVQMGHNLKQVDNEYSRKYMEHSTFLDKKINQIKINMEDFEKKTKIFDEAFRLKDKLTADMEEMKDTIRSIRSDKDKISDIEKQIRDIETLAKSTLDKSSSINAERRKIDNMSAVLTQLKNQFDETADKFSELKIQGDIAQRLNEKIAATNAQYENMQKVFQSLDETEQKIKTVSTQMDIINKSFTDYSHRADMFDQKLIDLTSRQDIYQKKFQSFENDSKFILQSEKDIDEVKEQFRNLEPLHKSLIKRMEEVSLLETKVNEAVMKYYQIDKETDDKISIMQNLIKEADETPIMKMVNDDESRGKVIVQMKKQGMTIDEIANILNISRQEAEMELGLNEDTDRRSF